MAEVSVVRAIEKANEEAGNRHEENTELTELIIKITRIGLILALVFGLVTIIGILWEPYKIRSFFFNTIGYSHGPFKSWVNETKIDAFDGKIIISKVSAVTEGWKKRIIWLTAKEYESSRKRELVISGISYENNICAGDDRKLDLQIKMDEKLLVVPTRLSKDNASLIFEYPDRWIDLISSSKKIDVRVNDECGIQTNFTFRPKRKMGLSKP